MDNLEIMKKRQRICDLIADLESTASDIGDWKIAKCMEYQAMGLEMPYDLNALYEARQAVRDEINQIQVELEAIEDN